MPITAALIFPSLIDEGQSGVGYDVRFDLPDTPLFLQFKLVHQMVKRSANEAKRGHFQPTFYRMHLRSSRISDQHESLLSLEQAGNDVYYVAPAFHTTSALNTAYAQRRVWDWSFRIRSALLGPLPDDNTHHVTFQQASGVCASTRTILRGKGAHRTPKKSRRHCKDALLNAESGVCIAR